MVSEAIFNHVLPAWYNDLLINVRDESLDKWCTDFLDSLFEPDIIVEKLPLSSKYAKIDCKVVVLTVNDLDQTIFDVLRDVKDSRKIHDPLLMSA